MNKLQFKSFIESTDLVYKKPVLDGKGFILKYKNKVFYDDLWNEELTLCRGLVLDNDYNIITRPFTKIFNYGKEKDAPVIADDEIVRCVRKVNGFMVSVSMFEDEVIVSTTGSMDSDFAKLARKYVECLDQDVLRSILEQGQTIMFECCDPSDPHIIEELPGLYLLGIIKNTYEFKINLESNVHFELGCYGVPVQLYRFSTVKELASCARHEGFVVYCKDGRMTKIKSPYYLVNKLFARMKTEKMIEFIKNGVIKERIEEEFYPLVDRIEKDIVNFTSLCEQDRLEYIKKELM